MPKKLLIKTAVADLRAKPIYPIQTYERDPHQETQLLFGECALGYEEEGEWIRIEAIEQPKYTDCWQGYPGWILKDSVIDTDEFPHYNLVVSTPWALIQPFMQPVCLGTRLQAISRVGGVYKLRLPDGSEGYINQIDVKNDVDMFEIAEQLLGHPYLWGGRSIYHHEINTHLTGLDCSSLIQLLYRISGKEIPRDAHDQFLKSTPQTRMKPGDLIFIRYHDKPQRIGHVMLYAGGDFILDANITDKKVIKTTALKRYGRSLDSVKTGEDIGPGMIYFAALGSM